MTEWSLIREREPRLTCYPPGGALAAKELHKVAYALLWGAVRPRQVVAYVARDGSAPFADWLRNLADAQARNGIRVRIARLRLGNLGDHKPVGRGVLELRVDIGPGYRVYIGQDGLRFVLLLCGGMKRTQAEDIRKAQAYWAEFIGG